MRKTFLALTAGLVMLLPLAPVHAAPAVKSYQVTGPVLDITDTTITVQKGTEKWQLARGAEALPADVKVGSKVTIQYTMTASSITAKAAK